MVAEGSGNPTKGAATKQAMINKLAISNYRSLLNLVIPLGSLNVITGPNGSGKSNLYRALRLLADTAQGGVINSLAKEGGLQSTFWAGPENLSKRMMSGEVPVQGTVMKFRKRLRLGFASDLFSYSISLGHPVPNPIKSEFDLDPDIKKECIWSGDIYRLAATLVDRDGPVIKVRSNKAWEIVSKDTNPFESIFGLMADPVNAPEVLALRDEIRGWRFYDHFRTDADAPVRFPQLGTRTPVLHHDGYDLASALQTIKEVGDVDALNSAISDAFPGASLDIVVQDDRRFSVEFHQHGLLRPLTGVELSDGTLRYLLWVAALLTPRPPKLLIMNEPETSLHPDLLPALARLIIRASESTQVWVVSHDNQLIEHLENSDNCNSIRLQKELGQTLVAGQGMFDKPPWQWPDKGK